MKKNCNFFFFIISLYKINIDIVNGILQYFFEVYELFNFLYFVLIALHGEWQVKIIFFRLANWMNIKVRNNECSL